jgi:release factor glutamine methyltransferase
MNKTTDTILRELFRSISARLDKAGIESPRLEAGLIIGQVLGMDRLELHISHEYSVSPEQSREIEDVLTRRLNHEPMACILGYREFHNLSFRVTPDVLIPRPETELLVETAIEWIRGRTSSPGQVLRFADIGTGSGNIAVSILHQCPETSCIATDISAPALGIARENAGHHDVLERAEFRHGNMTDTFKMDEKFDAILSNPPYISRRVESTLTPDVIDWEPHNALFSDNDGMGHIDILIRRSPNHLVPGGLLLIEIGHDQQDRTLSIVNQVRTFTDACILEDLSVKPRLLRALMKG